MLFTVVPVVTIPETKHTFNATESNWITCTAEGYPIPDIIWLNNNEREVDKDRLVTDTPVATGVGNLFSMSVSMIVRRGDDGVYTCVANNSLGSDNSSVNIIVQCKCKLLHSYLLH